LQRWCHSFIRFNSFMVIISMFTYPSTPMI
jgi:hypothetical protein